ncbi:hypothetical protein BC833DRAFT_561904 [Globomyces pollinis-pini]|nr:hypothetical protein BC833DRAFT_561904 [Globomyces pollinis-pini]
MSLSPIHEDFNPRQLAALDFLSNLSHSVKPLLVKQMSLPATNPIYSVPNIQSDDSFRKSPRTERDRAAISFLADISSISEPVEVPVQSLRYSTWQSDLEVNDGTKTSSASRIGQPRKSLVRFILSLNDQNTNEKCIF